MHDGESWKGTDDHNEEHCEKVQVRQNKHEAERQKCHGEIVQAEARIKHYSRAVALVLKWLFICGAAIKVTELIVEKIK